MWNRWTLNCPKDAWIFGFAIYFWCTLKSSFKTWKHTNWIPWIDRTRNDDDWKLVVKKSTYHEFSIEVKRRTMHSLDNKISPFAHNFQPKTISSLEKPHVSDEAPGKSPFFKNFAQNHFEFGKTTCFRWSTRNIAICPIFQVRIQFSKTETETVPYTYTYSRF